MLSSPAPGQGRRTCLFTTKSRKAARQHSFRPTKSGIVKSSRQAKLQTAVSYAASWLAYVHKPSQRPHQVRVRYNPFLASTQARPASQPHTLAGAVPCLTSSWVTDLLQGYRPAPNLKAHYHPVSAGRLRRDQRPSSHANLRPSPALAAHWSSLSRRPRFTAHGLGIGPIGRLVPSSFGKVPTPRTQTFP